MLRLLYCHWGDFTCGVRNLRRWLPLVWSDFDFDWEPLAKIMEFKLQAMASHFGGHGIHIRSQRDARRMRVAAELIKRVREDEYYERIAGPMHRTLCAEESGRCFRRAGAQRKNELELFGKIIGKHLLTWWD